MKLPPVLVLFALMLGFMLPVYAEEPPPSPPVVDRCLQSFADQFRVGSFEAALATLDSCNMPTTAQYLRERFGAVQLTWPVQNPPRRGLKFRVSNANLLRILVDMEADLRDLIGDDLAERLPHAYMEAARQRLLQPKTMQTVWLPILPEGGEYHLVETKYRFNAKQDVNQVFGLDPQYVRQFDHEVFVGTVCSLFVAPNDSSISAKSEEGTCAAELEYRRQFGRWWLSVNSAFNRDWTSLSGEVSVPIVFTRHFTLDWKLGFQGWNVRGTSYTSDDSQLSDVAWYGGSIVPRLDTGLILGSVEVRLGLEYNFGRGHSSQLDMWQTWVGAGLNAGLRYKF